MKNLKNLIIGIIIVCLGIVLGLNALEITDIDIFFAGWWTLFIIIPSFIGLFNDDNKTGNVIGLIIGISLLLCCQGKITLGLIFKLSIPVLLVIIGLSYILKSVKNNQVSKKMNEIKTDDLTEFCSTFSKQNINYDNQEFNGCNLNAIFGGLKCDLSNAKIDKDQVINASAIFGGIDIIVPEKVNVKVVSNCIFGGVSNKSKSNAKEPTLYINASAMFGGVDIK